MAQLCGKAIIVQLSSESSNKTMEKSVDAQ